MDPDLEFQSLADPVLLHNSKYTNKGIPATEVKVKINKTLSDDEDNEHEHLKRGILKKPTQPHHQSNNASDGSEERINSISHNPRHLCVSFVNDGKKSPVSGVYEFDGSQGSDEPETMKERTCECLLF